MGLVDFRSNVTVLCMNLKCSFYHVPIRAPDNTDLSKNPTTALYMLRPLYPHYTLLHVSVHKGTHPGSTGTFCAVAYPGIFFSGEGGSTNSAEDRGGPERGSGGRSPLLRGSGGSCNLVHFV